MRRRVVLRAMTMIAHRRRVRLGRGREPKRLISRGPVPSVGRGDPTLFSRPGAEVVAALEDMEGTAAVMQFRCPAACRIRACFLAKHPTTPKFEG